MNATRISITADNVNNKEEKAQTQVTVLQSYFLKDFWKAWKSKYGNQNIQQPQKEIYTDRIQSDSFVVVTTETISFALFDVNILMTK